MEEERKLEELNTDCLVKVLDRVRLESLILDMPFVCKSWYKASLNPDCWKALHLFDVLSPLWPWCLYDFKARLIDEYRLDKFSITGFVKFVVSRSRRYAVNVMLHSNCTSEDLEFISNECPALEVLTMPSKLLLAHGEPIPKLVSKWKYLQQLHLGKKSFFKEILIQISLNCKSFSGLCVRRGHVGNKEASAIAILVPKIKYLWLSLTSLSRESLRMILEGCKDLVLLDATNCFGFEAKDEEILKMASHIKTFMVEGTSPYDLGGYYRDLQYFKDFNFDDYLSD